MRISDRCVRGLAVVLLAFTAGCFYDSRWGQRAAEQRRNAARSAPAAMGATSAPEAPAEGAAPPPPAVVRTYRLRVYASAQYIAQTADWQRQVREVVEDANRVLAPSLGARLEVESTPVWSAISPASEDDLQAALAALEAEDRGADVDWVAGFVGALPKATRSFHNIGRSRILGKHIVVRAASRLGEHDAVESAFDELAEEERTRLRHSLKRHRASAVFLHEVGHTLGAPHETRPTSIMYPEYGTGMSAFGPETTELMRIAIARRAPAASDDTPRTVSAPAAPKQDAPPATPTPAPAAAPEESGDVAALREGDRAAYLRAAGQLSAGNAKEAYETAKPLFARYPRVLAVQDLRCKVAMARQDSWAVARSECDPLMKLSTRSDTK